MISVLALAVCASSVLAQPIPVSLSNESGSYSLVRAGKPYFVLGAGGEGSQALLARSGANSVRTWGADDIGARLDEAHKLGLTVTVGIWLEHPRHGFSYNDPAKVGEQYEKVKAAILKWKDHPALLMWGIGNEMEGEGNDAAIWSAVNNLASLAKRLDPNHPTMTVIAEMGPNGEKVKNIHRLCPDIDVIGINSYGGGASVAERYKKFGGTKPYIITEFGPTGTWETGRNDFGATNELTSGQKAAAYRATYEKSVLGAKGLCLGSYAFLWSNKFEATATWFGMLLPDGTRLAAVDTMSELWTGKPPTNRVPVVESLAFSGPDRGKPGDTLTVTVKASDPESDPFKAEWILLPETKQYETGGDFMATPEQLAAAVTNPTLTGATIKLPKQPGVYRLYVYLRDAQGGGATASLPLLCK